MNTTTIQQKERTAQLAWTAIIVMFFVIQAVIWTIAISITSRDASHTVVPNYDEQALKWDEVKSMRQASANLGWHSLIDVGNDADLRGFRNLTFTLSDKNGDPVEHANINLQAFHRGRAAETQNLHFSELEPGVYQSTIQLTRTGNWQFSGAATKHADCYLIDVQQYLQVGDK